MNGARPELNGEDLLLLLLLLWAVEHRGGHSTELLVGLGFLFYVGLRERAPSLPMA